MLIVYEGTPGSGKTYDAVARIIANLRRSQQRPYFKNDWSSDCFTEEKPSFGFTRITDVMQTSRRTL